MHDTVFVSIHPHIVVDPPTQSPLWSDYWHVPDSYAHLWLQISDTVFGLSAYISGVELSLRCFWGEVGSKRLPQQLGAPSLPLFAPRSAPKVRQGILEHVAAQAQADLANELGRSFLEPEPLVLPIVS